MNKNKQTKLSTDKSMIFLHIEFSILQRINYVDCG